MSVIYGNPIITNGGVKLNIDYGATPPSDTTKLWVPLATKPSAVEVTDQFSSSFGSPSVVFNSTDDQQYRVSGMSQISDNEIWFYNSSTGNTTNRFTKLNLSDKTLTRIGRGYVVNDVINHKGKLYCTNFGSTGSGWSWNNSPGEIDRNAGTIVALNPYSNAERGRDGGVSFGDYIWFISRTPNTVDGHKRYMYRYNPESSAAIAYTNTGAEFIYTSQLRAYNKKIYFAGCPSGSSSPYLYHLYEFDTQELTLAKILDNIFSVTISNNAPIASAIFGDNIYFALFDGSLVKINLKTNEKEVVQSFFPFSTTQSSYPILSSQTDNKWYVRTPLYATTQYVGTIYEVSFSVPVPKNNLVVAIGESDYGWNMISGKTVSATVSPYTAVLGNESGLGEATEAYLYNKSTNQWVSLSGVNYTNDMKNALNILGVN